MDYVILFILYTLVYAQGKNPYVSAFAFGLLVIGTNYYKKKQNVLRLTNLFEKALYTNSDCKYIKSPWSLHGYWNPTGCNEADDETGSSSAP